MNLRQRILLITSLAVVCAPMGAWPQSTAQPSAKVNKRRPEVPARFQGETSKDYNRRLLELSRGETQAAKEPAAEDYRIGTENLLDVSVFENTSVKSRARMIHTNEGTGARTEIPINLPKVLTGRVPDPVLHANDIVFVANSTE